MRFRCDSCGAQYAISDEKLGKKGVKVRCKKCGNIITVRPEAQATESESEESQDEAQDKPQDEQLRDTTSVDGEPSDSGEQDELGANEESPEVPSEDQDSSQSAGDGFDLGDDEDLHDALNGLLGDDDEGMDDEDDEDADMDRQATRVFNVEEMQQVQAEREQASVPPEDEHSHSSSSPFAASGSAGDVEQEAGAEDRDKVEWYAAVDDEQIGPISLNEFERRWKTGEFDSDTLVWKSGFEDWLTIYDVKEFAFLAEEDGQDQDLGSDEDEGSGWSPSFGAQSEDESDEEDRGLGFGEDEDEEEEEDGYGYGDEEDQDDGHYSGFDDEESSASAASAAFAADVDWKPAAISSLSDLAEQELASLKPEDPEPEEELPFDTDGELPSGGGGLDFDAEMEDGDSSLVAQIAAEEEAIRKQQEEQSKESENQQEAEETPEKELPELDAQEKARKEKRAEQVIAASAPEEHYIPQRSSLPKWAIGLMVGGGLMLLTLVGIVGYLLAQESNPKIPVQPVVVQKTVPVATQNPQGGAQTSKGTKKPVSSTANHDSVAGQGQKTGTEDIAGNKQGTKQDKGSERDADKANIASTQHEKKIVAKAPPKSPDKKNIGNSKSQGRKNKSNVRRKKPRSSGRLAMAPKEAKPIEKPNPKPQKKKSKGGLLDFEDPDDRAFAAEAGIKAPKTAPKVQKKKELPPLSNADVLTVMKRHLAEFKACNRKQKEVDSTVRGKMVVNFTIGNNGRVLKVGVSKKTARFKGTYVGGCIKSIIKRLKFPEFGGPKKSIPFPFTVN